MTLTLELAPETEAWLAAEAEQQGIEPKDVAQRVLNERAVPAGSAVNQTPKISAKSAAAIAYLNRRLEEEATDDPEEIRQAEEELAELKRNLNANRAATGERLVFP